jgi:pimeloyl-ACP methyl ester carboxylesterase
MPRLRVGETQIYFEVCGDGPAVAMLPGLATGLETWRLQVNALKPHHKCILIDNRGSGKSDAPDCPYTTSLLAGDVVAVLDEVGEGTVKIVGFSLGGAIAQQLAITYPERVQSLVLANSFSRVRGEIGKTLEVWKEFARRGRTDQFCSDLIGRIFTTEFAKNHSREVMAFRLAMTARPPSAIGLLRQIECIEMHDTRGRLAEIRCPTLVISASKDRVVSVDLGEELAAFIPHASLQRIPEGGHALFFEQAVSFNESLIQFFEDGDRK